MTTDRVLSTAWPETAKHFSRGNAGRGDAVERATRMVGIHTCDRVDVRSDKKNVSKRMFCQTKEVLMIQRGHEDGNRRFSLVPCNFTQL